MKIKEHLLDITYAIQDVWEEAENMTSTAERLKFLGPDETIKREMENNVKFLLFQQGKASFAFKKLFEQVYKEEGISL
tara:strand:- start:534 stop:767 length:234 start_codon:yes stop_codon:yes gene_type:complete